MSIDETNILVSDLEDMRFVLDACLTYFQARDMEAAQLNFTAVRSSPLTLEAARVKKRLDGVMGDYLLAAHESRSALEYDEDDLDVEEDLEDAEDGSEDVTEASEDVLPDTAFTEPVVARQKGRRLSIKEVEKSATDIT